MALVLLLHLHQHDVATPTDPHLRQIVTVVMNSVHCQLGLAQTSVTHNEVNAVRLEEYATIFTLPYVAVMAGHTTMNVELMPQELM